MPGAVVTTLADNPILTLFIVIGLGYLLGEISVLGFRFGIVGVLFMGLAIGKLSPSISVPEVIPTLGLHLHHRHPEWPSSPSHCVSGAIVTAYSRSPSWFWALA